MSNENNNLKVGANGAGLFVGNSEILGGVANIINHSANIDVCCVVINVTDKPFYGRIREMNSDYIFENIIIEPKGVYVYTAVKEYMDINIDGDNMFDITVIGGYKNIFDDSVYVYNNKYNKITKRTIAYIDEAISCRVMFITSIY